MTDLFDLCHSRWALAALVLADVSQDIIDAVKTGYNQGRISPTNIYLEVIQSPELLTEDPDRAKNYARQHFSLPDSPLIPCFYIVIDERTAQDGSVLFGQLDWPQEDDQSVRTMPQHAHFLTTGFIMRDEEWERVLEEEHDENDVYNPPTTDFAGKKAVVRFPVSFGTLANQEGEDTRIYNLEPQAAEQLGLRPGDEARTVDQTRRVDGTFGDHLYLEIHQHEIVSPSDDLRVWGTSEFFRWGVDSEL